ncbi:MAG: hypothetical protein U0236_12120 [Nitrospira sp.]
MRSRSRGVAATRAKPFYPAKPLCRREGSTVVFLEIGLALDTRLFPFMPLALIKSVFRVSVLANGAALRVLASRQETRRDVWKKSRTEYEKPRRGVNSGSALESDSTWLARVKDWLSQIELAKSLKASTGSWYISSHASRGSR